MLKCYTYLDLIRWFSFVKPKCKAQQQEPWSLRKEVQVQDQYIVNCNYGQKFCYDHIWHDPSDFNFNFDSFSQKWLLCSTTTTSSLVDKRGCPISAQNMNFYWNIWKWYLSSQKSNRPNGFRFHQDTDLGQPQSGGMALVPMFFGMQDWKLSTSFWFTF